MDFPMEINQLFYGGPFIYGNHKWNLPAWNRLETDFFKRHLAAFHEATFQGEDNPSKNLQDELRKNFEAFSQHFSIYIIHIIDTNM